MRSIMLAVGISLGAAGAVPRAAGAQLSLGEALRQADRTAYPNRIAAGSARASAAEPLGALAGILPTVRFEAGYIRTTDPIGVFGTTLRQRTITEANFDPQRLNHPGAAGNYTGGIVVEQPLFNADAWTGRRAALDAAAASRAGEEWTRITTRVDVVRAYYGAVLAAARARTLQAAARAAHAHVAQAAAMVRQGLATRSDALLASVRAGEVDAQLAEAEGGSTMALRQLAVLLGVREGEGAAALQPPANLPAGDRIRAVLSADTAALLARPRADVLAATRQLDAARADEARARSGYVPRINSFARYDWNSAADIYAGERNWTVGIMASWSPFAGAREWADVQAAGGRASAAAAGAEAARATAQLELEQTRIALVVALVRLDLAEQGATQSAEAHRIVGRKYDGGLATITELLDAQAVETRSALALSQAQWTAVVAGAERLRALGRDPGALTALDGQGDVAQRLESAKGGHP